jgi:nicotinate phosphoribosyltransferase
LLVDTVDTLQSGIPNAIRVFEELRRKGHEPVGIRLDSGDLAYLSIQAARMLDDAGFPSTSIVLSNQLDELVILQILTQIQDEASLYGVDADGLIDRLVYGVGTRLITSGNASALDGVYKLVAVEEKGEWTPAIKISETRAKIPNPGNKRVWRLYDERGNATADLLALEDEHPADADSILLRHPTEPSKQRVLERDSIPEFEPLLLDVLVNGTLARDMPTIEDMRQLRDGDLGRLDAGVRRLVNPHTYHVSLSGRLWELKEELVQSLLGKRAPPEQG